MRPALKALSPHDIRKLLVEEAKKFSAAIALGSTLSDLEEIKAEIKYLQEQLALKEQKEQEEQKEDK